MSLNLRALALFKAIYWSGSITGGAARTGVSQPSASRMLRHLEEQLGYALFERTDGRIRATREAQILIQEVDAIFLRVEQTASVARRIARGGGERMAVVCVHMLATSSLPRVMDRLHRRFPELELELDTKGQAEQVNMLLSRGADLGIATGPEPPPSLAARVFGRARLMAVLPASHPLASRKVVRLEDYARHPCILSSERDPLGGLAMNLFARHGIRPNVKLTIGSPLFCHEAVRTFGHLGIAGPMTIMAMAKSPSIAIRPIEPVADYAIYALWNIGAAPSAARETFLKLMTEELKLLFNVSPEGAARAPAPADGARAQRAPASRQRSR
jgi:DNA-binding transcriptional LysR family regulator